MESVNLHEIAHRHCRFKLRGGKEVFGVVWEVETGEGADTGTHLFFASIRDYERLINGASAHVVPITPGEILAAERLAG